MAEDKSLIPEDKWRRMVNGTEHKLEEFNFSQGDVVTYFKRVDKDLILMATFRPNSASSHTSALVVSLSLKTDLRLEGKGKTGTFCVVERVTNIFQGKCSVLLIPEVNWEQPPPRGQLRLKDCSPMWMGLRPMSSSTLHADIQWSDSKDPEVMEERFLVWKRMTKEVTNDWWLWLPPIEVSMQKKISEKDSEKSKKKSSKSTNNQPPEIEIVSVVAYMQLLKDGNDYSLIIYAGIHPILNCAPPDSQKHGLKVTKAKVKLALCNPQEVIEREDTTSKSLITSDKLKPFDYPPVVTFELTKDVYGRLDPKTLPHVSITFVPVPVPVT